jgi:hypothetical protein
MGRRCLTWSSAARRWQHRGLLRYIDQSPVGGWINHFTQGAKATGIGSSR